MLHVLLSPLLDQEVIKVKCLEWHGTESINTKCLQLNGNGVSLSCQFEYRI